MADTGSFVLGIILLDALVITGIVFLIRSKRGKKR